MNWSNFIWNMFNLWHMRSVWMWYSSMVWCYCDIINETVSNWPSLWSVVCGMLSYYSICKLLIYVMGKNCTSIIPSTLIRHVWCVALKSNLIIIARILFLFTILTLTQTRTHSCVHKTWDMRGLLPVVLHTGVWNWLLVRLETNSNSQVMQGNCHVSCSVYHHRHRIAYLNALARQEDNSAHHCPPTLPAW